MSRLLAAECAGKALSPTADRQDECSGDGQ